jgi:hypothetical protein
MDDFLYAEPAALVVAIPVPGSLALFGLVVGLLFRREANRQRTPNALQGGPLC